MARYFLLRGWKRAAVSDWLPPIGLTLLSPGSVSEQELFFLLKRSKFEVRFTVALSDGWQIGRRNFVPFEQDGMRDERGFGETRHERFPS
jgi:hypothetical protein